MIEFSKYVKMYENYKVRHNLGTGITREEIKELRESYSNESKKERILEARRKESNDSFVAPAKRKDPSGSLKEKVVAKKDNMSSEARIKAIKEANSATITNDDENLSLNKKLNEARKAYLAAKKALREGDIPGAIDQSAIASDAASQAVDAVGAQTVASPEVVSTVQSILSMVQSLAASIGAVPQDTGVTPEADPNAAVPAQVDQPLEPVMVQESVQESDTIKAVKARIAERKAKMDEKIKEVESLNESAATDQIIAGMKAGSPIPQPKRTVDKTVTELPKAPSVTEVENGTAKGVVRWPNKPITKDPSANQLGKGAVVNETEEKTLDELAVDKVLNEKKLNFKEIFSNGMITAK